MNAIQFLSNNFYLVILAAMPFFVAGQVWYLVRKMSEPEKMLRPMPGGLSAARQQILANYQGWLNEKKLFHIATYQFGSIQVATYQQQGAPRFFSFYFHKQLTFCAETYFDDDDCTCLDTGTSGHIGMFPRRPHQYQQSFPQVTPEIAWQRHLEAENYLMERFGIKCRLLKQPYEQILTKAMRLRMTFVRSIPLYPFRALYWYAISRSQMANRSIQQQFP